MVGPVGDGASTGGVPRDGLGTLRRATLEGNVTTPSASAAARPSGCRLSYAANVGAAAAGGASGLIDAAGIAPRTTTGLGTARATTRGAPPRVRGVGRSRRLRCCAAFAIVGRCFGFGGGAATSCGDQCSNAYRASRPVNEISAHHPGRTSRSPAPSATAARSHSTRRPVRWWAESPGCGFHPPFTNCSLVMTKTWS
jgi:hypothetical protein